MKKYWKSFSSFVRYKSNKNYNLLVVLSFIPTALFVGLFAKLFNCVNGITVSVQLVFLLLQLFAAILCIKYKLYSK